MLRQYRGYKIDDELARSVNSKMNVVPFRRLSVNIIYLVLIIVCFVYTARCVELTEYANVRVAQPVAYSFSSDDDTPDSAIKYATTRLLIPQQHKHTTHKPPEENPDAEDEEVKETAQKITVNPAEEPVEARSLDGDYEEILIADDASKGSDKHPLKIQRRTQISTDPTAKDKTNSEQDPSHKTTNGEEFESLKEVPKFMNEEWTKEHSEENLDDYRNQNDELIEETNNRERVKERSDRTLIRPKKNQLSEKKYLSRPKSFSYAVKPKTDDQKSSPSGHHHKKKKKKKHHSEKHSKGGGKKYHSDHHSSSGKKGDKGYKGYHKYEKGKKGHHDKESHKGAYKDQKGKKKKHKEEESHFGEHKKLEKGKKGSKFGESGEHKKGHSTKGEHNIHKKDEYLKKHEFYDEHHEGGDHEKHGGFHAEHGKKHGGKKKSGHHKSGHHDDHHGKKGHFAKGNHHKDHKGHKEAGGHEEHHSHKEEYAKKGGHKDGKKWGYSKKDKRHVLDE